MDSQLVLDNVSRPSKAGTTFERRHPVSGEVVTRAAAGGVNDAIAAVDSASAAFKTWRHSPPSERRRILLKAADALEARTSDFIQAMAAQGVRCMPQADAAALLRGVGAQRQATAP